MSKTGKTRQRNADLRTLNRFTVARVYPEGIYRVRPRGCRTVLFTVERSPHVADEDYMDFMGAVKSLADNPPGSY